MTSGFFAKMVKAKRIEQPFNQSDAYSLVHHIDTPQARNEESSTDTLIYINQISFQQKGLLHQTYQKVDPKEFISRHTGMVQPN